MRRHIAACVMGAIVAIALGNSMGCHNGAGPATVPEPREALPPASPAADVLPGPLARVAETAASTEDVPPWHDCLHDDGGGWQVDDGRRCVAIQYLNTVTGWGRRCGHNRAYFPSPDYRCCVDDGLGQCVPGSERWDSSPPEEPEPEETSVQEAEFEDWRGPKIWIYGANPPKDLEICEGDYVEVLGLRRANSVGELRGSVYLWDPERETTMLEDSRMEGPFRFAADESQIETYVLDERRIGRCPDCGEKREVILGIDDRLYSGDGSPVAGHRVGAAFVYQVRKATDELCQPG